MKKLVMIALMLFVVSVSVNAQKTDRVFIELTRVMLVSRPMETVKHENMTVSYWEIQNGAFYYLTAKQEFHGKYKTCNFVTINNKTTFLGVDKKKKRHIKRNLLSDIKSSRNW